MKKSAIEPFFEDLAKISAEVILPLFRSGLSVADKAGASAFDPVTEADRSAEAMIRAQIKATFPEDGILGEEFGSENMQAEYLWVIDPIDGTRSFVCGIPLWGTLIGLLRNGTPIYGMMHQPYIGELFTGDSKSAFLKTAREKRALSVRACASLSDAYLMTTTPTMFAPDKISQYQTIERQCRLARYGADCYAYMMLASGQIDLVIESGLKPYDILPLVPIIEGAGGIVTNWKGRPVCEDGDVLASGDRRIHEAALRLLNGD